MPEIKIPNTDVSIIVDQDVYEVFKDSPFTLVRGYAILQNVLFHRIIANTPKGYHTHHKNLNKLDNQRENLQVLTEQEHAIAHILYDLENFIPKCEVYTKQELIDFAFKINGDQHIHCVI